MFLLLRVLLVGLLSLGASLRVNITPTTIELDVSKTLVVNCSFSNQSVSSITNLISLTLSIADSPQAPFTQLATLDIYSSDQVSSSPSLNATASGHIDGVGESYLSAVWTNPTVQQVGIYLCEADGLDSIGQPNKISQTAEVTYQDPGFSNLTEIVRVLLAQGGDLANAISTVDSDLRNKVFSVENVVNTTLESYISLESEIIANITQLQAFENITTERFERMKNGLFELSEAYNGSVYYLSKHLYLNADVAEARCEYYGGYLAEIEDAEEHEFIKNFTVVFDDFDLILVGPNDEAKEGEWVFRYSKRPVSYLVWGDNQPDALIDDCMVLRMSDSWKMWNYPCYDFDTITYEPGLKRYLCEVPTAG